MNTVPLIHFLLGRVAEDRPTFVLEAIGAVERGLKASQVRLRTAAIRTLGSFAFGTAAQERVLAALCQQLEQLQAQQQALHHGICK